MQKLIFDLTSKELLAALEANMIAFRATFGRAKGCTFQASSKLIWFYTRVGVPVFNGVLFAQLNSNEIKATVELLQAKIEEHQAPALWWDGPHSKPAQLGVLLEGLGLHPVAQVPAMAIELAEMEHQTGMLANFKIEKVTTREMQAVWAQIAADGLGFSDTATNALVQLESSLEEEQYKRQPRYLGFLDGIPVATCALALESGVAGIYMVTTLSSSRGKGIGRAMTVLPLLEARALGYRVGVLQASQMGYSLYHKLGFKQLGLYRLYLQSL